MFARAQVWIGLGVLPLAMPGVAHAADSLECMAQSYDATKLAEIAGLSTKFSFDDDDDNSTGDELSQIGVKATYECSEEHGWSEHALYYAVVFELGRLSEAAYRQSGHLTDEQIRRLEEALASRDRSELWALMEKVVVAGLENRDADTTSQEDVMLGSFLYSAGFGDDEALGLRVGELLGTMALQRIGRREFNALVEGE